MDPPQDPEPQGEPIKSPNPLPKGQAEFSITRSGTNTTGLGALIEVVGEFPIDIYFTQGEEAGPEIVYSEGHGFATTTMFGEGTIGSGELIGDWNVKFEVRGVFLPAPDCSLELSITEIWEEIVKVRLVVAGQVLEAPGGEDTFVIWKDSLHEFGNVKIPWGIGKVTEDYIEPDTNWINTYEITSLQVPFELTGCDIGVEVID